VKQDFELKHCTADRKIQAKDDDDQCNYTDNGGGDWNADGEEMAHTEIKAKR
jgi:hypothetical protein